MHRAGRPRKINSPRKPGGRLYHHKKDERFETGKIRVKRFGVTRAQSISPLAGYLAGVLYIRRRIELKHLAHYYSFLQLLPRSGAKAIEYKQRVQGGRFFVTWGLSGRYQLLLRRLGKEDMGCLNDLARDQLTCPISRLKRLLIKVPLTPEGTRFSLWCEMHNPRKVATA